MRRNEFFNADFGKCRSGGKGYIGSNGIIALIALIMALLFGFGSSSLFGDFGQHGGIQQEEGSADKVFITKSRETQKPPAQTQNNTPSAVLPDDKDIERKPVTGVLP